MDKKQQALLRRLGRAYGKSARIYFEYANTPREYLAGYPVYMREADFLEELDRADSPDGVTMGTMASLLGITQGAVTQIATRLMKKRLCNKISKQRGPALYSGDAYPAGKRDCPCAPGVRGSYV